MTLQYCIQSTLKYGSEVWVLNKKKCQQLETAQTKFLISLLGLTRLDHQRNKTTRENLKVEHIVDEIQSYQNNWLQHVKRTEHSRIHRIAMEYTSKGKGDIGGSKIRWRDQQHL